jgi:hypothetical protein
MISKLIPLFLAATLPAQIPTVLVMNQSSQPYEGVKRVYLHRKPPHDGGWLLDRFTPGGYLGSFYVPIAVYSVANITPDNKIAVDVYLKLNAGEVRQLNFWTMDPVNVPVPQLPPDLGSYFQGLPVCNGAYLMPLEIVTGYNVINGQSHNGAGYTARVGANINSALTATMDITWYPFNEGWLQALVKIRSNANYVVPPGGVTMSWPGALVMPYQGSTGVLIPEGRRLTIGEEVEIPVTIVWWQRIPANKTQYALTDINYLVLTRVQ